MKTKLIGMISIIYYIIYSLYYLTLPYTFFFSRIPSIYIFILFISTPLFIYISANSILFDISGRWIVFGSIYCISTFLEKEKFARFICFPGNTWRLIIQILTFINTSFYSSIETINWEQPSEEYYDVCIVGAGKSLSSSILFYSILFYYYNILFYSILFHPLHSTLLL